MMLGAPSSSRASGSCAGPLAGKFRSKPVFGVATHQPPSAAAVTGSTAGRPAATVPSRSRRAC